MSRVGDWMQTYSGRQFWPIDPRPEEMFIEDIAHHLAMQCRYAGATIRFYSVAEHCVLMARWLKSQSASRNTLRWALLHDASEAYILDVIRPLKPALTNYKEIEARVMNVVAVAFGLEGEMPQEVHQADMRICADERDQIMRPCVEPWNLPFEPLGIPLPCWSPDRAKLEFLVEYQRLFATPADKINPTFS